MDSNAPNLIPTGVEPVDKLIGGLESGQLYLVHGDPAARSLFGIKFLIEGLKQGEQGALVARYSPEDAVRRFARLGYDCLEDVYSGRLVILEYSKEMAAQMSRLPQLTPVLRELEWLLGETRPQRLVFDPITTVIASEEKNTDQQQARLHEFADWATSFGSTIVLISNGGIDRKLVSSFRPLVNESFRFSVREIGERIIRFLSFEKSPDIPDQAVEVDPSRGVFLLGRAFPEEIPTLAPPKPQVSGRPESKERFFSRHLQPSRPADPGAEATGLPGESPAGEILDLEDVIGPTAILPETEQQLEELLTGAEKISSKAPTPRDRAPFPSKADYAEPLELAPVIEPPQPQPVSSAPESGVEDPLADLIRVLNAEVGELYIRGAEKLEGPETPTLYELELPADVAGAGPQAASQPERERTQELASLAPEDSILGSEVDSRVTASAVESLLRPPEIVAEVETAALRSAPTVEPEPAVPVAETVRPDQFNVLIIDDDPASSEMTAQSLSDYTVEVVHDGLSGLAKLLSFKPDLVILDVDLPIVDGFKVLAYIRSSLNVPVITISGSHMRASDRVLSAELGADYYLTRPFSMKELRQRARQLIARYRGINSWIITSGRVAEEREPLRKTVAGTEEIRPTATAQIVGAGHLTSYKDFVAGVEKNVKTALDSGSSFSIVGCKLSRMTESGGRLAVRLLELLSSLVRETDLVSTSPQNDVVLLLGEADVTGARAFVARLRERVLHELNQELSIWMRSFPDLVEGNKPSAPDSLQIDHSLLTRRASDRRGATTGNKSGDGESGQSPKARGAHAGAGFATSETGDPQKSYIDILKHIQNEK